MAQAIFVDFSQVLNGLNDMLEVARQFSGRTPAIAANTAGYRIALVTHSLTPRTAQGRIDDELAVKVVARTGKRGQPLSIKQARNRLYNSNGQPSGGGKFASVPLAWLMISARAKLDSDYNLSTNGAYAIWGGHPLKGQRRANFKSIMDARIGRMVKARHSSTGFIAACWLPAIQQIAPYASKSATRGLTVRPPRRSTKFPADAGWAIAAKDGEVRVFCEIANAAGMSTGREELNASTNRALWQYSGPAAERAIAQEFWQTVEYIVREEAKAFNKLAARGITISI